MPPDDLLDEDIPGEDALTTAEDQLPEIAEQNELTVPQLVDRLDDDSVWVDTTGVLYYVEPLPGPDAMSSIERAAGPFPADQTFLLHSRAGSSKTIYLDFDGHTLSDTFWPADDAGPYQALPFDSNGVSGSGPRSSTPCRASGNGCPRTSHRSTSTSPPRTQASTGSTVRRRRTRSSAPVC